MEKKGDVSSVIDQDALQKTVDDFVIPFEGTAATQTNAMRTFVRQYSKIKLNDKASPARIVEELIKKIQVGPGQHQLIVVQVRLVLATNPYHFVDLEAFYKWYEGAVHIMSKGSKREPPGRAARSS